MRPYVRRLGLMALVAVLLAGCADTQRMSELSVSSVVPGGAHGTSSRARASTSTRTAGACSSRPAA